MTMDYTCWITPIKPGKTDAVRRYCEHLETDRRADYEASQLRIKTTKEVFFLWSGPDRDYIVLYMEADDMVDSLKKWDASNLPFETWGKGNWVEFIDGIPQPLWAPPGSPCVLESLSFYEEGQPSRQIRNDVASARRQLPDRRVVSAMRRRSALSFCAGNGVCSPCVSSARNRLHAQTNRQNKTRLTFIFCTS